MRFIKVLLLLVLFIFGLLFFVQNSDALATGLKLKFNLYYGFAWEAEKEIPFYFVVLASFGVGMLFATGLLFIDRIRLSCNLMSEKRSVRSLKNEVERMRNSQAKEASVIAARTTEVKELPQKPVVAEAAK